jgi:hypothetical protein
MALSRRGGGSAASRKETRVQGDGPDPGSPIDPSADAPAETPGLRRLRILVTVLTVVMIGGVVAVAVAFVTRLAATPAVVAPEALVLPEGVVPFAVTRTPSRWLVTTADGRLLIFGPGGELRREVPLD